MSDSATSTIDLDAVAKHLEMLEERVFQVRTKWPHFRLLLADVGQIAAGLSDGARVTSLERTLLYGGYSLFAPLFPRQTFTSVDCSPASAESRGAYNAVMIEDPRAIRIHHDRRGTEIATGLDDASQDAVLVPSLVHHVADQAALFGEIARIVKPGGVAYVFEPLLRELHQEPDDFLRYTPYGMKQAFAAVGLRVDAIRTEGGPFQAIAYCWEQALQYFPDDRRPEMEQWFWETEFPKLLAWDREHRLNQVRRHTSFPVAFSLTARKAVP